MLPRELWPGSRSRPCVWSRLCFVRPSSAMSSNRRLALLLFVTAIAAGGTVAAAAETARLLELGERIERTAAYRASVEPEALETATRLEIALPEGRIAAFSRSYSELPSRGHRIWAGQSDFGEELIASRIGDRLVATVFTESGVFELTPSPGGYRLSAANSGDLPECDVSAIDESLEAAPEKMLGTESAGSALPRVDVLVVYGQRSREAVGSTRDMAAVIQHYVDLTNVAFHNSEVSARVRLVGAEEVTLPSDVIGSNSQILGWVSSSTEVDGLRDKTGADLVGIVYEDAGTACGSAAMIYRPGGPTLSRAFFESRRGCGANTFAHEVGHLMGADHDPENSAFASGEFIYGRGHFYDARYRTIMAYAVACDGFCPQQPFFSNPGVSFDGSATGRRNQRDNARILSEFATDVERFTPEVTSTNLCTLAPGHPDYCFECGPCVAGEGGCEADSECVSGLACSTGAGPDFGFGPSVNVCLAKAQCDLDPGDPDYCRLCGPCGFGVGDCDDNRECQGGLTCLDDVGADFGLAPSTDVCAFRELDFCPLEPGDPDYCEACGPCRPGDGNCKSGSECATFASCIEDIGPEFGFPAGTNLCLRATPENCPFDPGSSEYCRLCGLCDLGEGDCDGDRECAAGLECADGAGSLFGFDEAIDVCVEAEGAGNSLKAPKKLKATALSSKKVRLRWKDRSKDESGFYVEMSVANGPFERVATTTANKKKVVVKKLAGTTMYTFRVQAFNALGTSKFAKVATVTTP